MLIEVGNPFFGEQAMKKSKGQMEYEFLVDALICYRLGFGVEEVNLPFHTWFLEEVDPVEAASQGVRLVARFYFRQSENEDKLEKALKKRAANS